MIEYIYEHADKRKQSQLIKKTRIMTKMRKRREKRIVIISLIIAVFIETTFVQTTNQFQLESQQQQQQNLVNNQKKQATTTTPKIEGINVNAADENGLYLVGLFDIHHSNPRVPFKCGQIDIDSGENNSRRSMQNMEAFLWAIKQVNEDQNILPGIKLGSIVLDTCSSLLKTNQQMINLLHNSHFNQNGQQLLMPHVRQITGIIADSYDWASVESVVSLASSIGLTTFVTQSRSTKLNEMLQKYNNKQVIQNNQQDNINLSNINYSQDFQTRPSRDQESRLKINEKQQQQQAFDANLLEDLLGLGVGRMMTNPFSLASMQQLQSKGALGDNGASLDLSSSSPNSTSNLNKQQDLLTAHSLFENNSNGNNQQPLSPSHGLYMIRMLLGNEMLADGLVTLLQQMNWDLINLIYDDELDMVDLHDELARQLFSRNIQLALDEQLPSPLNGGAREVRSGSGVVSSNLATQATGEIYDKLLKNLAKKAQLGSRVVICLLGTGSSRQLLSSLNELREELSVVESELDADTDNNKHLHSSESSSNKTASKEQLKQLVNSLVWITISDREPYYSFATDALGTIAVSQSVSLIPEFKKYFDKLKLSAADDNMQRSQDGQPALASTQINRWWPEYIKAILTRHQRDSSLELIANECARWQEPKVSPLNEKCRSLTLSSLAQIEKTNLALAAKNSLGLASSIISYNNNTTTTINNNNNNRNYSKNNDNNGRGAKLSKYLAGGWKHNGMDVINSVLSIANGLESIRQALCPNSQVGICEKFRELIFPTQTPAGDSSQVTAVSRNDENTESSNIENNNNRSPQFYSGDNIDEIERKATLSELLYNELLRSTFQLADGRMFNLNQDEQAPSLASMSSQQQQPQASSIVSQQTNVGGGGAVNLGTAQLEGKLKFYNLRYLQPNSIGFVKFAQFDQQEGMQLNISKAKHYSSGQTFKDQIPLDGIKSTCQDERKCIMSLNAIFNEDSLQAQAEAQLQAGAQVPTTIINKSRQQQSNPTNGNGRQTISEEELAFGLNSLFKLDHPSLISSTPTSASSSSSSSQRIASSGELSSSGEQIVKSGHNKTSRQEEGEEDGASTMSNNNKQSLPVFLVDSHIHTLQSQLDYFTRHHKVLEEDEDEEKKAGDQNNHNHSNSSSSHVGHQTLDEHPSRSRGKRTFNTIVLLPLHKRGQVGKGKGKSKKGNECSEQLDLSHSFQHLASLAYAQNKENIKQQQQQQTSNKQSASAANKQQVAPANGFHQVSNVSPPFEGIINEKISSLNFNQNNLDGREQIELTTTVIDYCEQIELAKSKLANRLSSISSGEDNIIREKPVAVIDFDGELSEQIDGLLADSNILHITIGSNKRHEIGGAAAARKNRSNLKVSSSAPFENQQNKLKLTKTTAPIGLNKNKNKEKMTTQTFNNEMIEQQQQQHTNSNNFNNDKEHLRVSLLPSKSNEIEALVKLISKLLSGSGKRDIVHLLYTDHHHYRDEFVRRANEANICVSKLIWIPQAITEATFKSSISSSSDFVAAAAPTATASEGSLQQDGSSSSTFASKQLTDNEASLLLTMQQNQLDKMKSLFTRELYNFSNSPSMEELRADWHKGASAGSNEALHSARVLVVLASAHDETNRLIMEAASETMLNDYIWITSHEWLNSIEKPAEQLVRKHSTTRRKNLNADDYNELGNFPKLPKFFLSTQIETFESYHFKSWLTSLTPSIHRPMPTVWFDEFWQQYFKCRLPISSHRYQEQQQFDDENNDKNSTKFEIEKNFCSPNQRLNLNDIVEDDKVYYAIKTIESISIALQATPTTNEIDGITFSKKFKKAFEDLSLLDKNSESPLSKKPYGFDIYHRLLPSNELKLSENVDSLSLSMRRENSRNLDNDKLLATKEPLVRVGQWRDGHLFLVRSTSRRRSPIEPLLWLEKIKPNYNDDDADDNSTKFLVQDNQMPKLNSSMAKIESQTTMNMKKEEYRSKAIRIEKSLKKLIEINRLSCEYNNSKNSCYQLCENQIKFTKSLIKQEETFDIQNESIDEPKAVSSIHSSDNINLKQTKQRNSEKNLKHHQIFDYNDYDNLDDHDYLTDEQEEMRTKPYNKQINGFNDNLSSDDNIQASATSLTNSNPAILEEQLDSIIMGNKFKQSQWKQRQRSSLNNNYYHVANLKQGAAILMSTITLIGIIFTIISMTYLYPNMLNRANNYDQCSNDKMDFFDNVSCSSANSIYDTQNGMNKLLSKHYNYKRIDSVSNLNDYFLLTGLLMLYSINIAFLLPAATISICWFRRIGLATSYTIIFSSILVKIMTNYRQSLNAKSYLNSITKSKLNNSSPMCNNNISLEQQEVSVLDPIEETIEVNFESLSYDQTANNNHNNIDENPDSQQQQQQVADEHHLTNGYQTQTIQQQQQISSSENNAISSISGGKDILSASPSTTSTTKSKSKQKSAIENNNMEKFINTYSKSSTLLIISLCLIISQILISVVLFIRQPPEPTLYSNSWHCCSPIRAPILFQYDIALSLIYPALILLFSCMSSILTFRFSLKNEKQFKLAAKTLLNARNQYTNNSVELKRKQNELDFKLRDAKSLVMTTNLLILTWSLFMLSMISSSQSIAKITSLKQNINTKESNSNDIILVYANIISGAIIFTFLFLYRLHLFNCFGKKSSPSGYLLASSNCKKNPRSRAFQIDAASSSSITSLNSIGTSHNSLSRFNLSASSAYENTRMNNKWLNTNEDDIYPIGIYGSGQLFSPKTNTRQERLKLQQFNNTYGTYSSTTLSEQNGHNNYQTKSQSNSSVI